MVKISVVVPGYNEEKSLPLLADKVGKAFRANRLSGELLIVDDGSTDNTLKVLEQLKKKHKFMRYIGHRINLGLTQSLTDLFRNAKGEIIVFLPADLESDPEEDIPILVKKIEEGYDVACGWRQNRKEAKLVMSRVYNWLLRILFKINLHDANWIKAFRRETVSNLNLRSDWHRYLPILIAAKGYKVGEVAVGYKPRPFGKSKYGIGRLVKGLIDMLVIKFLLSFGRKPMFVFGSLGLVLFVIGLVIGLYLLYYQQFVGSISRPLLTFDMLVLLVSLQLFAMGFLAELIIASKEGDL
ncbi:MAG TPA: glycosyltransferase family 2 protein [Nanoarchaeota archaeon]|nr:glycosyltransferase family 2 protein [Nanoarchaeota archaeon]